MDLWSGISNFGGGILGYTLPFLFILGIVVGIHEYGHYIVGRWCGVRVLAFSMGFGREICAFVDRHGTRWRLALWPLGGYVRFFGDANAASMPDEEKNKLMTPEERAVSFFHKPVWQRSAIVAAGPLANFLFAILIMAATFWFIGVQTMTDRIRVAPDTPAAVVGMKDGDIVRTIDGQAIKTFADISPIVRGSKGAVEVTVERQGAIVPFMVTPGERAETVDGVRTSYRVLGIAPQYEARPVGATDAVGLAVSETGAIIQRTLTFLGRLFTGREDVKNLGGAIKIAQVSKSSADNGGLVGLLSLAAIISISVGIMNLLPVPVLDGGHLMFYAIEAIRRRPLTEQLQEVCFRVGFGVVVLWMLFVNGNDIYQFLSSRAS